MLCDHTVSPPCEATATYWVSDGWRDHTGVCGAHLSARIDSLLADGAGTVYTHRIPEED